MSSSDFEMGFLLLINVVLIVLYICMLFTNIKSDKKVKQQIKKFKNEK
jgi:Ca2+/H+ antiporter